jgi:hypothetical protein
MTWSLEADVELTPSSHAALVTAWAGYFAPDLESIQVLVTRGDWPEDRVFERALPPAAMDAAAELATTQGAADRTVLVRLVLRGAGDLDYRPEPELYLFGDRLVGMGSHRRRATAVLGLGDRNAWRGRAALPSGRELSEATVAHALKHVCATVRPEALYLSSEEQVSFPLNDHFVYHRQLDAFATDLADVVQISLRGGSAGSYADARARYEPALDQSSKMMFGKRRGEYLDAVRRFLAAKLPRLEARGLPEALPLPTAETALLASDDLDFFFTEPGLGFHDKPLLAGYVEGFYLSWIDSLLEAASGER